MAKYEDLFDGRELVQSRARVCNARIDSARISNADHGVLTVNLSLRYGESEVQGFGGYLLHKDPQDEDYDKHNGALGHFIWRVLDIAGVYNWEDVTNKPIRALILDGLVIAIGHYLEDEWFCPKIELA